MSEPLTPEERLARGIEAAVTLWLISGDVSELYTAKNVAENVHRIIWEQHDRLAARSTSEGLRKTPAYIEAFVRSWLGPCCTHPTLGCVECGYQPDDYALTSDAALRSEDEG